MALPRDEHFQIPVMPNAKGAESTSSALTSNSARDAVPPNTVIRPCLVSKLMLPLVPVRVPGGPLMAPGSVSTPAAATILDVWKLVESAIRTLPPAVFKGGWASRRCLKVSGTDRTAVISPKRWVGWR